MQDQLEVCQKMATVRNRGLVNARDLAHEVERLSDWREHVRAHPLPAVVAVAALSYWLVPSRPPNAVASPMPRATRSKNDSQPDLNFGASPEAKSLGIGGLGGAVMGFVGSLVGNAVRSYVSDQIQTLIHSRGEHGVQNQWPTPAERR